MRKLIKNTLVALIAVFMLFTTVSNGFTTVSAKTDISALDDGEYNIGFTNTFTNPYDGNKVDGTTPSDMAISAGNNIMNKVMGPEVTFQKTGDDIYVTLLLQTTLNISGYDLENLVIYVEDSEGSNTYSEVTYTIGDSVVVDGVTYEKCTFKVDSLNLVISPRYKLMSNSGYFIVLEGTKASLSSKLAEAKAITSDGITEESYATLQEAITAAEAVYDNDLATQEDLDEQIALLTAAITALVYETVEEPGFTLTEGTYEVPVTLYKASADEESMVAGSLVDTARIVVKDGKYTVYISTQEGTMGLIPGFQLANEDGTYTDFLVESTNSEGEVTSFSITLEELTEYLAVKVLTDAETKSGMAARIKFDYSNIVLVNDTNTDEADAVLEDGIYEVPVALWHATEDRQSMAGGSLVTIARLVVKDGVYTVYIYTQTGTMGLIPGFQLTNEDGTYTDFTVETTNSDGAATSFSITLEELAEYVAVKVLTDAETKSGMEARLKFDFSQIVSVSDDTVLNEAPVVTDNGQSDDDTSDTTDTTSTTDTSATSTVVKTGDPNTILPMAIFGLLAISVGIVVIRKKRFVRNEKTF